MEPESYKLPEVGDRVPPFEFETNRGLVRFPEYTEGNWCIVFAHPANFTSAWTMFNAYIGMKERWLSARNTKVLAICNETLRTNNDWSDKARRFLGICMKAPILEDLDFRIARLLGIASGRRPQPGLERLALIVDPEGIVRLIINRPLPNIESALSDIERELNRLQGGEPNANFDKNLPAPPPVKEAPDALPEAYLLKAAHFPRKTFVDN